MSPTVKRALEIMEASRRSILGDDDEDDEAYAAPPELDQMIADVQDAFARHDYDAVERGMKSMMKTVRVPPRPKRGERPRCGAKCRDGHACKAPVVWLKGEASPRSRCRIHGGASTGPTTPEGKEAIRESNRRRRVYWYQDDDERDKAPWTEN